MMATLGFGPTATSSDAPMPLRRKACVTHMHSMSLPQARCISYAMAPSAEFQSSDMLITAD